MGMLEDSLNQIIMAQNNSLNFLLDERKGLKIREQLLHEDLERFTLENNELSALNNNLAQKINILEKELKNLNGQVESLISTKALKIINLVV